MSLDNEGGSVDIVLRHRGFDIVAKGDPAKILIPLRFDLVTLEIRQAFEQFHTLFEIASFRKFARAVVLAHGQPVSLAELKKISGNETIGYVDVLATLGVVERLPDTVRLTRPVDNIGPTLEWFVAELLGQEMGASAAWGVKLAGLSVGGGDYDVLTWLPPALMYVEVKSSRPSEISDEELKFFLQRSEELAPELAVLLVDTESSLDDLVQKLCEAMRPTIRAASGIADINWRPNPPTIRSQVDFPGVYWGWFRTYVTSSEPSILTQLRRCLRHYHRYVRGKTFWGTKPVNFVTGTVGKPP